MILTGSQTMSNHPPSQKNPAKYALMNARSKKKAQFDLLQKAIQQMDTNTSGPRLQKHVLAAAFAKRNARHLSGP